jgi:hypothetical protein
MRIDIGGGNYSEAVVELPNIYRTIDATADDSDKTFTVPDGYLWKLNTAFVKLVTTATVGNRQIVIEAKNTAGTVIGRMSAGAVQAASLTRYYQFMQGTYRETAFINNDIQIPIPADTYLPAGYSLRIYDSAVVDAAADDMTVGISCKQYKV